MNKEQLDYIKTILKDLDAYIDHVLETGQRGQYTPHAIQVEQLASELFDVSESLYVLTQRPESQWRQTEREWEREI
jgi:hypothetical protein